MRKEVENKINEIVERYKTVKIEDLDRNDGFIIIKSYKVELNDGTKFYRDKIIKNKGLGSSSSILPVLKNGNILLVVEPRVFTKKTVEISISGGYIDEGETKIDAAKRELEEETGLISNNIVEVAEYYPDMGNSEHINTIYIAFDSEPKGKKKYDDDEFIDTIEVTEDELYELIDSGRINNAATIIAALKLKELKKTI